MPDYFRLLIAIQEDLILGATRPSSFIEAWFHALNFLLIIFDPLDSLKVLNSQKSRLLGL